VQCPKCNHYQDFSSLGACETCGKSEWEIAVSADDKRTVSCIHCERGPEEVPCDECGAPILGKWLGKVAISPAPPRAKYPLGPPAPYTPDARFARRAQWLRLKEPLFLILLFSFWVFLMVKVVLPIATSVKVPSGTPWYVVPGFLIGLGILGALLRK